MSFSNPSWPSYVWIEDTFFITNTVPRALLGFPRNNVRFVWLDIQVPFLYGKPIASKICSTHSIQLPCLDSCHWALMISLMSLNCCFSLRKKLQVHQISVLARHPISTRRQRNQLFHFHTLSSQYQTCLYPSCEHLSAS